AKKIEGTVGLLASIAPNGTVENVQVTEPLYPSLDRSAAEALRKWRFEPVVRDGKPAAQQFHVEMLFSRNGYEEKLQPAKMEQDPKQSSGEKGEKAEMERRREMETNEAQMRELKERAERDLQFKVDEERRAMAIVN